MAADGLVLRVISQLLPKVSQQEHQHGAASLCYKLSSQARHMFTWVLALHQLLPQCLALFTLARSLEFLLFLCRAGEHPLLRLVLQPPTDGLLQPGGTFGLLLDFRAAHGGQAAAGAAASSGSSSSSITQPVCLQVGIMHDIVWWLQLPQALWWQTEAYNLHQVVVPC